jgi:hypothetical protein
MALLMAFVGIGSEHEKCQYDCREKQQQMQMHQDRVTAAQMRLRERVLVQTKLLVFRLFEMKLCALKKSKLSLTPPKQDRRLFWASCANFQTPTGMRLR